VSERPARRATRRARALAAIRARGAPSVFGAGAVRVPGDGGLGVLAGCAVAAAPKRWRAALTGVLAARFLAHTVIAVSSLTSVYYLYAPRPRCGGARPRPPRRVVKSLGRAEGAQDGPRSI
jgi:hypothetical protein